MDDKILAEIAALHGTPSYVFDLDALTQRAAAIREIFGESVSLCFSIKANPFLISAMAEAVDKIEVCSPGELSICEKNAISPEKIVFSGVNKTENDVARAVSYGAGIYTAESGKHLRLLEAEGAKTGKKLPVILRLTSGNQFGVDEKELRELIAKRGDYPHLSFEGLHYFAGTQRTRLTQQKKELDRLSELIDSLKADLDFEVKRLEYGAGLAVPYFENEDFSDTLAPSKQLAPALQKIAQKVKLTVEMGRFFTAECGHYLTSAEDIKSSGDTNYCIVDGGIHHLNYYGQTMAMKIPKMRRISQKHKGAKTEYCICGSLCTINDVLVRSVTLEEVSEDDIISFENTGAYSVTEGMSMFLSRKMPKIILYTAKNGAQCVRKAFETDILNTSIGE